MLWIALGLLAASVVVGVVLLLRRWQDAPVPVGLVLGHALPAVAGLGLAYSSVSASPLSELADAGLVLLAVAAVGGLLLLGWQLRSGRFSLPAALLHALVGAAGLLLVLLWAVTRPRF